MESETRYHCFLSDHLTARCSSEAVFDLVKVGLPPPRKGSLPKIALLGASIR